TSPGRTVRVSGTFARAWIVTWCVRGASAATASRLLAARAPRAALAARRIGAALLGERRLQHLGVLEVGDESRADRDEQALQLGVLRARDERLVDRVEHLLVVRDLVIDVRLVEGRAAQLLEVLDVVGATRLQALAGGVVLGRHLELGDE